jgi:hypothetical protein
MHAFRKVEVAIFTRAHHARNRLPGTVLVLVELDSSPPRSFASYPAGHPESPLINSMKLSLLPTFLALSEAALAFQPPSQPYGRRSSTACFGAAPADLPKSAMPGAAAAASVALSTMLLLSGEPAFASSTAAQISLNNLPPTSISVQIQDLPVVGSLLSGTYTKVADGSIKTPSVTITSPSDKVKAISEIATGGHLEFDVSGLLSTHMDVDVSADEPGVAKVRVASGLIPKLPFKNLASGSAGSPTGGKPSPWNMVTNLGSGGTCVSASRKAAAV